MYPTLLPLLLHRAQTRDRPIAFHFADMTIAPIEPHKHHTLFTHTANMEEAGHLAAQALSGDHTEDSYHPRDAVGGAIKATLVTGTGGAFVSAVQNTLTKQNVGAWGVFTRTGGTVATFGKI